MAITISAAEQTGNRVAVTIAGLSTAVPAVDTVTLWRDDLSDERVPVRGYLTFDPTADGIVAYDNEAPLARPVFYTLEVNHTDGSLTEHTTAAAVVLDATHPILSEPISGEQTEVAAIVSWPLIEREGRGTVVEVVDRSDPIVVSGGLSRGSSAPVLRTDTLTTRKTVRRLLETAQVLQIRDPHPDVEDQYVAVAKYSEARLTNDPADVRRTHQLDIAHVGIPAIGIVGVGDTLADLETAFLGQTLAAIAAYFPGTLLDIASTDLATV